MRSPSLYKQQPQEFPSECKEKAYTDRIAAAYPIHPELFDRLYDDWSSLEKFQRTRGVLRLMAAVIHSLWEAQDSESADHAWHRPDRRRPRAVSS